MHARTRSSAPRGLPTIFTTRTSGSSKWTSTRRPTGSHVPGATAWNWTTELCDTIRRDIIPKEKLEGLLGAAGIGNATTVILYGDNNNWFAAWALWQLKLYGHEDVRARISV